MVRICKRDRERNKQDSKLRSKKIGTGGGGTNGGSPPVAKSGEEIFFDVIDALCNRFMGLSPFEVLNRPTREVFNLYIDYIIHDRREKSGNTSNTDKGDVWVTSANATWH